MADLLSSLVVPASPRSSQESFRSLSSQPHTETAAPSSAKLHSSPPAPSNIPPSAFEAAGLPVYDIDSYLAQNVGLRATPAKKPSGAPKESDPAAIESLEPVPLGTKTSFYVGALNQLCQSKGFFPIFEIEGDVDFGGILKLRDAAVASDRRWPSKREARESLAEKGLEVVKGMEAKGKEPGVPQAVGRNWVGMLLEYYNLSKSNLEPIVYQEYALGSNFTCTCTIPSLPGQTFGSKTRGFSSKKDAKTNAAKEAVEYLIGKGELNADGSTKARKKAKLGTAVRIQGKGLEVRKETTYAQKVNDICPLLGLTAPHYHLAPASDLAPNMLSGYATFPNAPGMPAEVGEVRNVFGKKKAKEEVAKGVWEAVRSLAAQRNVSINEKEADEADGEAMKGGDGSLMD